jgi:MoaA/NifB/PqqE/SkfB family radical SAM enzyme
VSGRLLLRWTTECNSGCAHCTVADIRHHPERSLAVVWQEIAAGRARGCDELVFMRGEVTLKKDLLKLVKRARHIGYHHIQVQTNGRMLAYPSYAEKLMNAGVNFFEVSFFGHVSQLHDAIDGTDGAYEQAVMGLKNLVDHGCDLMVTVPVLKRNYMVLSEIVRFLRGLGIGRVQMNFSRPVKVGSEWLTEPLVRLGRASPFIREALALARDLGMVAETEAVPFCHLDAEDRGGGDVEADFSNHQLSDLQRTEHSLTQHRIEQRPMAPACEQCTLKIRCPKTWSAYQQLFGTWELQPLDA